MLALGRFLGYLLGLSIVVPAAAKARELPVCVEVVVQHAPPKPDAEKTAPLPAKAAATAPAVPPPPDTAVASSSSEGAEATQSIATPAPAVPPLLGPRSELVEPPATGEIKDTRVQSGAHLPLGQTPEIYLRRLLEHFVTHERGFVAVKQGCEQHIVVDMYPLKLGWTVFARYSGTGREERVDQLLPTELSQFAERSVLALLHDVSINETVDRGNVLWADSLKATQTIRGRGHFVVGFGSRLRAGRFATVNDAGAVEQQLRVFTPMLANIGYRGQFEEFGVEALAEFGWATGEVAADRNKSGGHVDYGGSLGLQLHAMRYVNVRGLSSLYFGGGATFALHSFSLIRPESRRSDTARASLWTGGLDVDGVIGCEFIRASTVSFYVQGEVNLPAYAARNENEAGSVNSWFPGAALKIGAIF